MEKKEEMKVPKMVMGTYEILEKIGSGSFGVAYKGLNIVTKQEVAIKLEPLTAKHCELKFEAAVYTELNSTACFPEIYWHGEEGGYSVLIMEILGKTLESLFNYCKRKFTLKTVLLMLDQMVRALERLHAKSYIHRDIKPENFVMGTGKKKGIVYLIDFGLSRRFRDRISGLHIPYRVHKSFIGTVRYASIKTHFGIEQSRRDDLESLGNMVLYFLKGTLPWQNVKEETKEKKYEEILKRKVDTSISDLCKDIPEEFQVYMAYCRGMKFNQRPDYRYIIRMFRQLSSKHGINYDFVYDWTQPDLTSLGASSNTSNELKSVEPTKQVSKQEVVITTNSQQHEKGSTDATVRNSDEYYSK